MTGKERLRALRKNSNQRMLFDLPPRTPREGSPEVHFGHNCEHLQRDRYPKGLCALAVSLYEGPEYSFLDHRTNMSVKEASHAIGIPEREIVEKARSGELEWFFPKNVAKRVGIPTRTGERRVTVKNAAKRLHKSMDEITEMIERGDLIARYPDELMRIVLVTRWDAQQCPLLDTGGICSGFMPHNKPQIGSIGEAPQVEGDEGEEETNELGGD